MSDLDPARHPDVLVGIAAGDDAGVLRLADGRALVQSVDFFTPIVDEAADWGRIAAANALSDLYAMGAEPLAALQMLSWPRDRLPLDLAGEVLVGAAEVLAAADCALLGGHSIDDPEPKFGLAVTGVAAAGEVVTLAGAQPGDRLALTKPLGTGVISTAIKEGLDPPGARDAAVASMTRLNRGAARAMTAARVHAATDVTGFGLLGHLVEMLRGNDLGAMIDTAAVPLLPGAHALAEQGIYPGGSHRNLAAVRPLLDQGGTAEPLVRLLADAQTSGGLLMAVPPARLEDLLDGLVEHGDPGTVIGTVEAEAGIRLV